MKPQSLFAGAILALFLAAMGGGTPVRAAGTRFLPDHVPAAARSQPIARLPSTNILRLAISLPLRNRDALTNLLQRLQDPASPDYHHYLTPAQFNDQFAPTAADYQKVVAFARSNHFNIVNTRDSRMLLDVEAAAPDAEKAFHVTLRSYHHPTENRDFFAPDTTPSVDTDAPILDVVGLSDYAVPRPMLRAKPKKTKLLPAAGSADGYYIGNDFRNAYVPGVALNGAGQTVGLLELDGYYSNDITSYESFAGLPNVPITNVNVYDYTGPPGSGVIEVSLDIELAIAMAPGLASVVVFQAGGNVLTGFDDILDSMASSNSIKQFSSSWGYTGSPDPNTTTDSWLQKMQTQGQSFYQASGDGDAWINPIWVPADSPYLTSVGGTSLTMNGTGASYASETVWNAGNQGSGEGWSANENTGIRHTQNDYVGSSGGVSTVYAIPSWQTNAINAANHGSSARRNIPDVALAADNIFVVAGSNEQYIVSGTSCAAPLWAGFTALVNQQAAATGSASVGFINPAIYALGQTTNYAACFHDTTAGNNTNIYSTNLFPSTTGFDLCTGWGTPNGAALINALSPEPLRITPATGFASTGPYGGPFTPTNTAFLLTNLSPTALNWSLINTSSWLTASASNGTLVSNGTATVNIGLSASAATLAAGSHTGTIIFSNLNDTSAQSRSFTLAISKATPVLTWANPAAIAYGTALSSAQLDAAANVSGILLYNPTNGTVPNAGTNTLAANFTPADTADYNTAAANVSLIVLPAPLSVTASNATRSYGTANPIFTGNIAGVTNGDNITAAYSCIAATNSPVGLYSIMPSLVDPGNRRTNYAVSLTNGTLAITQAVPVLNWPTPSPIIYGASLDSNQLTASANVPGAFVYTPAPGAILPPGTNVLSVLFNPSDATDYTSASDNSSVVVAVVPISLTIQLVNNTVVLSWSDPASVFTLQTAPAAAGIFTNILGATNPFTNAIAPSQQYFRLLEN